LAGRKVGEIAKLTVPVERDYLLLDRSGSMAVQWREALDAINAYAGTLGSKINTRIWMAVFDNAFDVLRNDIFPAAWRPITDEEVQPRGSTALDDSIAAMVAQAKHDNPDKAALVIASDSGENASTKVTTEQAKKLLDECRARGWEVIFFGMGFNNSSMAAVYGADPSQTVAVDKENLATTLRRMAEKRVAYSRSGTKIQFSDSEKKVAGGRLLLTQRSK
jgi:hypothetical protein